MAQLVAHLVRNERVRGSSPLSSTRSPAWARWWTSGAARATHTETERVEYHAPLTRPGDMLAMTPARHLEDIDLDDEELPGWMTISVLVSGYGPRRAG